jgi:hypothetical protein
MDEQVEVKIILLKITPKKGNLLLDQSCCRQVVPWLIVVMLNAEVSTILCSLQKTCEEPTTRYGTAHKSVSEQQSFFAESQSHANAGRRRSGSKV